MNFLENIRNALGAIGSNKMRSGLTMLGIIIGVSSVVLLVAIGQGAQRSVTSRIQNLGTNLLTVSPGSPNQTNVRFGGGGGGGSTTALQMTDAEAIKEFVTGLSGIEPEMRSRFQVIYGSKNTNTTVVGTTEAYTAVRNAPLAYGSFITAEHVANVERVAVLGPTTLSTLFPDDPDPLGRDIRIGGNIFTVIGVMESKGQQGLDNSDDMILVPVTSMQKRLTGAETLSSIAVSVAEASDMDRVQEMITAVLLNEHRITDVSKQDFTVLNQADAVETLNEVTSTFTLLLGGIAAISLLVGGIGVMNIMLVSVTERTREIGVRKAIGAKKRDILLQFLVEAVVLSVLGGLVGILFSAIGSWLVTLYASLDASIALSSVFLAFGFSVCVGVCFGMLPAWKAAKLRPIEALRYE
ncbi:MAG: ABC transporter permease [Candidatus Peribacteraceae bacterium]|nr:ABC transporter permease [Candidatus Peribacteraceae bacterium]